jgi:hypothetical protein
MQSFAARIAKETALVYDLRITMDGEARYFIIKVPPAKRAAFVDAVAKDAGFTLEDYGDILFRGWNEPSDEVKAILHERYGMYGSTTSHYE